MDGPTPPTGSRSDEGRLDQLREALGDEFEVLRSLGRGATSVVFLARERALGRLVAIKVLRRAQASDETARRRFEREARAAASISEHPDVVAVHRYGRLPDGTPFLVMRYVKGRTMGERLAAEGRLPVDHAVQALLRVASALAAAHEMGIVHRDVRPGNVLWDDEAERAYLSDFGIAGILATSGMDASRITQTGQLVGDPRYLSPEQLQDQEFTEQSDLYGLGILGYELLTGQGPYEAQSNADWIRAHLSAEPRPLRSLRPEVPPLVADLVRRCLSKEPNHRPRAADVVRILDEGGSGGVGGVGGGASPPLDGDIAELIKRRVPQLVGLALTAGISVLALVGMGVEIYQWPTVVLNLTIAFVAALILSAMVGSWFHGEAGRQKSTAVEWLLYGAIAILWLGASAYFVVNAG